MRRLFLNVVGITVALYLIWLSSIWTAPLPPLPPILHPELPFMVPISSTYGRCTTTDTTACSVIGILKMQNYLLSTPTGEQAEAYEHHRH